MLTETMRYGGQMRYDALMAGVVAVDFERGAYLRQSYGRGKGGAYKYWLLYKPANAGAQTLRGLLEGGDFEHRSSVRAWSLVEALEIAERRLAKHLAKKGQKTP